MREKDYFKNTMLYVMIKVEELSCNFPRKKRNFIRIN